MNAYTLLFHLLWEYGPPESRGVFASVVFFHADPFAAC